ncbi:MAG TPA: hypothetical protein VFN48_04760 [Solirubrobacteraceae bacterium]|nr:hypothetical protein [Solirubrobacteraceae bacterium]
MSTEPRLPPVTQLGMLSLALIVAAGIDLSAHLPREVGITVPGILLGLSAAVLVINLLTLARVPDFAWDRFFGVARWALAGWGTVAALIEYVFLQNHTHGGALIVLSLSLIIFAVHVPMLIGFTVARVPVAAV